MARDRTTGWSPLPNAAVPDMARRHDGGWRYTQDGGGGGRPVPADAQVSINRDAPSKTPIPKSRDFYQYAEGLVLGAGAGTTIVGAPLLQLGAGEVARIAAISIFINAPTLLTSVTFQVLVNGAVVPGYDQLRSFPRAATNLSIDIQSYVRVQEGAVISTQIINQNANGPWTVGMLYTGWRWSKQDGINWYGEDA